MIVNPKLHEFVPLTQRANSYCNFSLAYNIDLFSATILLSTQVPLSEACVSIYVPVYIRFTLVK